MDCPVCENAMITLELSGVEIDHCLDCGGIWLDAGELEELLDNYAASKELIDSFKIDEQSSEKKRPCPICNKKMQKILVGQGKPPLLLDRCPKSHGLWFDKGELEDITEKAQLDGENKIKCMLADMFGSK